MLPGISFLNSSVNAIDKSKYDLGLSKSLNSMSFLIPVIFLKRVSMKPEVLFSLTSQIS